MKKLSLLIALCALSVSAIAQTQWMNKWNDKRGVNFTTVSTGTLGAFTNAIPGNVRNVIGNFVNIEQVQTLTCERPLRARRIYRSIKRETQNMDYIFRSGNRRENIAIYRQEPSANHPGLIYGVVKKKGAVVVTGIRGNIRLK
ncbi:MAG: DUF4252 domain-containing protein [Bacteroidaceae bacterium]|nr:DUF4252 domain-containing protein [Bacteroidaceae bacterium]